MIGAWSGVMRVLWALKGKIVRYPPDKHVIISSASVPERNETF